MTRRRLAVLLAIAVASLPAVARAGLTLPPLPNLVPGHAKPPPRPSRDPAPKCTGDAAIPRDRQHPRATPVFPCDFADPSAVHAGGYWYAYATSTGWEPRGRVFPVLRSRDLSNWHRAGDALGKAPRWSSGDLWAPSVMRVGRRYLLYYSAQSRRRHVHCLGVGSASRPQGPYADRGVIGCGDRGARGYIDPAPLRDRRGRLLLFFSVDGPKHSLSVLPLRRDGLRASGRRRRLFGADRAWNRRLDVRTVEGPSPMFRDGRYYLFYSSGYYMSDYRMGYAVARTPLGPYRDFHANPILRPRGTLVAPGGGTVLRGSGGRMWLAFHAWTGPPDYARNGRRTLRIAPVRWRGRAARVDLSR